MKTVETVSPGSTPVKEIPIPLVRANQWMFILTTLIAIILSNPWIILVTFAIALTSLLFGPRVNPAIRIARLLLGKSLARAETESVELQRFNQVISVFCLALSTLSFVLFGSGIWLMWIFAAMITIAATAAVCGYCIGCKIYYRYKMSVARWRKRYPKMKTLFDFIAGTDSFKPSSQR